MQGTLAEMVGTTRSRVNFFMNKFRKLGLIEYGGLEVNSSLLSTVLHDWALKAVIEALGAWGVRWAFGDPRPEELDSGLLVWKIHQRINRGSCGVRWRFVREREHARTQPVAPD
jgi:hypothetical protein